MVFPSRLQDPESQSREPLVSHPTVRVTLHLPNPERVCSIIETDIALKEIDGYSILRAMGLYASIARQWNSRPLQSKEEKCMVKGVYIKNASKMRQKCVTN